MTARFLNEGATLIIVGDSHVISIPCAIGQDALYEKIARAVNSYRDAPADVRPLICDPEHYPEDAAHCLPSTDPPTPLSKCCGEITASYPLMGTPEYYVCSMCCQRCELIDCAEGPPGPPSSATPRTDQECRAHAMSAGLAFTSPWEFARQLERELAATEARISKALLIGQTDWEGKLTAANAKAAEWKRLALLSEDSRFNAAQERIAELENQLAGHKLAFDAVTEANARELALRLALQPFAKAATEIDENERGRVPNSWFFDDAMILSARAALTQPAPEVLPKEAKV